MIKFTYDNDEYYWNKTDVKGFKKLHQVSIQGQYQTYEVNIKERWYPIDKQTYERLLKIYVH